MAVNSVSPLITGLSAQNAGLSQINIGGEGDFGTMVKNAVENIDNTQKGAETEIAKAVAGETNDLHKTIIALQTADLKFQLGLQVRNKIIGAYDEIMRMPV